jgi:hypothetical protein
MTLQLHSFAIGQQEHKTSVRFVLEVVKPAFTAEYIWHITRPSWFILRTIYYVLRSVKCIK